MAIIMNQLVRGCLPSKLQAEAGVITHQQKDGPSNRCQGPRGLGEQSQGHSRRPQYLLLIVVTRVRIFAQIIAADKGCRFIGGCGEERGSVRQRGVWRATAG